jgi:hypothetical protein
MPFIPDAPVTAPAFTATSLPINRFHITRWNNVLPPGAPPTEIAMEVEWAEGYDDAGVFRIAPNGVKTATLSGPSLVTAMAGLVTPGLSHYDDLRIALWNYMESIGLVGPGSVT